MSGVSIEDYNPWWRGELEEDFDLEKWRSSPVRWRPRLLDAVKSSLTPFSLNFLFGPRQVGKTTLAKLLIAELAEAGADPKSLFYYSCDELADYKELDEVLGDYLSLRRRWGVKSSVIVLDEATYPREWYRAVKARVDKGDLRNDVVLVTGSLSMAAKREVEAFPGRRGLGRDFVMHPLSFGEFASVAEPSAVSAADLTPFRPKLDELLKWYLKCGGYPRAVVGCLTRGEPGAEVEESILSNFKFDLVKLRRSEAVAKRVLKAVIEKAPSPFSLSSAAREFEAGSHKVVAGYIELLENLYLAKSLYYMDPNALAEDYRKGRKVHLTDPLLYKVFAKWAGARPPGEAALLEAAVAVHFARKYRVGYWRGRREVDVVVPELGLGVEVKRGRAEGGARRLGRLKVVEVGGRGGGLPASVLLADLPELGRLSIP